MTGLRDHRNWESRGEVRLERVQVIWLTLGALVAMGLTFALGVVVGRRAAQFEQPGQGAPIAEIDADTAKHDELTFYDRLSEKRARADVPPRPSAEPAPVARPKPQAESEPVPAAEPSPAGAAAEPAAAGNDPVRIALDSGPATAGDYTVQVSSFQSMAEARAYSAKLERKGFKPFIVRADINGKGTWFRVRMGRFDSEGEAKRAKGLLARADIPAWVLRTE